MTNSSTSNYWSPTETDGKTQKEIGTTTQCYAAFVMGRWVEGCVYDDIGSMKKAMVDKLLLNEDIEYGP